jgi:hypothetical protein
LANSGSVGGSSVHAFNRRFIRARGKLPQHPGLPLHPQRGFLPLGNDMLGMEMRAGFVWRRSEALHRQGCRKTLQSRYAINMNLRQRLVLKGNTLLGTTIAYLITRTIF